MNIDVLELTGALVAIPSASQRTNVEISNYLKELLESSGFQVEWLEYEDDGQRKVSLVAKKGEGEGGLGFFSHSDTVPGAEEAWDPYDPVIREGKLYGRGSCDMKGPLAATIAAAARTDASALQAPLFVVVTADEEVGYGGARQVAAESTLLREGGWPAMSVVAEPTQLIPVYAHKGGYHIYVTAHGHSAHTSTDVGISANFLIAPFLAEMAELVGRFKSDEAFMNHEFDPPTNGFNMILNDGGTASNVTAARTQCTLSLRTMPDDHHQEALALITERAKAHNLEVSLRGSGPFYIAPDAPVVQVALAATGLPAAQTVPFGTEALVFQEHTQPVVLGPGNIAQAHTVGEYIDVAQLQQAVDVYARMIERVCL